MFGPEYPKIQTLFKRDERNVIVPGDWTTEEFAYLRHCPWRWTEKVDGTNIRVHFDGVKVTIGGRTDNAQVPTFLIAALDRLTDTALMNRVFADSTHVKPYEQDVTLYGEGYGPKIQSGGQYRSDPALILFDVKVGQWWLRPADVADVASKLGLEIVPDMGRWTLEEAVDQVSSESIKSRWPGARLEGLVGTPAAELFDRRGDRIIAKIKGRDFADLKRRGAAKNDAA